MKILHHCSPDRLAVSAEDGSIAELDRVFGIQEQLILEPGNWFWFSRIKAKKEGQGVGTRLMTELVALCDEHRVDVFCQLNPYGQLDYEQLRAFYRKFGFVDVEVKKRHAMIRRWKSVTM